MHEEELIALVPTIAEELTSIQFRNDVEQLDFILAGLLGDGKMSAYEALDYLEDLLAARRTDFYHAAKLYLNGPGSRLRPRRGIERPHL